LDELTCSLLRTLAVQTIGKFLELGTEQDFLRLDTRWNGCGFTINIDYNDSGFELQHITEND
jgi:hypothetical protein